MLCNVTMYFIVVYCPLYIMQSTLLGVLQLYAKLMNIMNMINILYEEMLLTIMKLWQTLYQQVVRVFGDRCEDSMQENGTYCPASILWDFM